MAAILIDSTDCHSQFWDGAGPDYAYGMPYTSVLARMNLQLEVEDPIFDSKTLNENWGVSRTIATSTPGLVFVVAQNITDTPLRRGYLLRSEDAGETFVQVLMLGDTDGTEENQIRGMTIFTRGLCEGRDGVLFAGEYYSSIDQQPIRLMKSTDAGKTWSQVAVWNQGAHNIRHIHAVMHNPYAEGDVSFEYLVCTGDEDAQCGLIPFNGISLASNLNPGEYPGAAAGAQRYRVLDVLYDPTRLRWIADTDAPAEERGIWGAAHDLTGVTRYDDQIVGFDHHSGGMGVRTANCWYFGEFLEPQSTDKEVNIYGSTDGNAWEIVAKFGCYAAAHGGVNLLQFGDYLLFGSGQVGGYMGKIRRGSAIVREYGAFDGRPRKIWPRRWVAPWGYDSTSYETGCHPYKPWRTFRYAMTAANDGTPRICQGMRVTGEAGRYAQIPTVPSWSNAGDKQSTGTTIIEGAGEDETTLVCEEAAGGWYVWSLQATESPIQLRDLALEDWRARSTFIVQAQNLDLSLARCKFVDKGLSSWRTVVNNGGALQMERCTVLAGADNRIITHGTNPATIELIYTVTDGGHTVVRGTGPDIGIALKNCTFSGYRHLGVDLHYACTLIPTIKNCLFAPGEGAVYALLDGQSLVETDAEIDYNLFVVPAGGAIGDVLYDIDNDGGSHSIAVENPLLEADLRPQANSLALGAGVDLGLTSDRDGALVPRYAAPAIGAYEFLGRLRLYVNTQADYQSGDLGLVQPGGVVGIPAGTAGRVVYVQLKGDYAANMVLNAVGVRYALRQSREP